MSIIKPYRYIKKEEIEHLANHLLSQMQQNPKYTPTWPFDATRVADFLDIGVFWDKIPPDEKGSIAAMILPVERQIVIKEDIPGLRGGFGQSTIAHEIGHLLLHIDKNTVDKFVERLEQGIEIDMQPFLCRSVSGQLEKIEWQAQYFASCLLMPRHILGEVQKGRDLTRESHLDAMAHELGVTKRNLKHRLKDISWIHIPEPSKTIYLGEAAPSRNKRAIG
ncbi:ImmA/IrrE family metallo-endopeptidase [Coleofasciculus sp. FACHB-T130]|uniref:ImmA/IrrE family metallo-endopeptidase n=1 Tax=Cyanophyceae TaxID=3028117 RepID=UPI0016829D81|nr:ImmA/IrrE family metallo-endopeptidase [Coleofasciculus sp. FACHB-T130]MBD1879201.1 ImmA/IrrE family metallo-endopeptidase [Coleofasciculus sp. FACHB-T130]